MMNITTHHPMPTDNPNPAVKDLQTALAFATSYLEEVAGVQFFIVAAVEAAPRELHAECFALVPKKATGGLPFLRDYSHHTLTQMIEESHAANQPQRE